MTIMFYIFSRLTIRMTIMFYIFSRLTIWMTIMFYIFSRLTIWMTMMTAGFTSPKKCLLWEGYTVPMATSTTAGTYTT